MIRNRWLAVLLAIPLCLSGCAGQNETSEIQQQLKLEGMELQAAGDYAGAIAKYEEALKLADMQVDAEEIDIAYYKASAQYRSGDLEGAIDTYSAILAVKESENTYLGRGLLYEAAGEYEKAKEDLTHVLKETDDPLIRGIIYSVQDQIAEAKKCFEEAQKAGDPDAVFYLANVYERTGDHNYALLLLEEYIAGGSASADGYLCAAESYFEAADYKKALEMVQAGISLGESGVLKSLLQEEIACYERLGDFESAKAKAEDYLEQYPDDILINKEYEFLKSR